MEPTRLASSPVSYHELAQMIDHTLLHPGLTDGELELGCRQVRDAGIACVCVKPYAVADAVRWIGGSPVAVGTTVGFPHGSQTAAVKAAEAEHALAAGARELDMVVNLGKVLSKDWASLGAEIGAVLRATRAAGAVLKVVFECAMFQPAHTEELCRICADLGVDFVQNATGFGDGGATDVDLRLLRRCLPSSVRVKAAGGIRSCSRLLAVVPLGVTRVATTMTRTILEEARTRLGGDVSASTVRVLESGDTAP